MALVALVAGCGSGSGSSTSVSPWRGLVTTNVVSGLRNVGEQIAAGDVTGDGKSDLLVPQRDDRFVWLYPGRGNGTFETPRKLPLPLKPRSVTIADVNGDRRPDVIAAGYDVNGVAVLHGAANGEFTGGRYIATDNPLRRVLVTDVTGDLLPDIVTLTQSPASSTVTVERGDGHGQFERVQTLTQDLLIPGDLAVADMNGDGKTDIIVAGQQETHPIWIYYQSPTGGFSVASTPPPLVSDPTSTDGTAQIAAADLDRDGKADLLTTHNVNDEFVSIRYGQSDSLTGANRFYVPVPYAVAVTDLDRDGKPDFVTSSISSDTLSYFMGQGGRNFSSRNTLEVGDTASGIVISDFNGDTYPDIALMHFATGAIRILMNRGRS